ncbi:MAG: hypothetical protein ACXVBR_12385 [Flavisolibacter sp.]
MKTKNLIHIGYPKAGSSFLQAWFAAHPAFAYENGGIGGYANLYSLTREASRGRTGDIQYFVTSFEGLATPQENADGLWSDQPTEKPRTPHQCRISQKAVCETLHSIFPEGKVLIITRGFKGIIQSSYSQYLRVGGQESLEEMLRLFSTKPYHQFINYDYLITLYREQFGSENVIVLPYECLREDPEGFLALLEQKLEVPHAEIPVGIVNPSLTAEQQYWYRFLSASMAKCLRALGKKYYNRYYPSYVHRLFYQRFDRVIRLLIRLMPGKKMHREIPPDILQWCAAANLLKDEPLYAPYRDVYLIE